MSQKLVVSVDSSADHPDRMTVQDVFAHVLDLFQLVMQSDPASIGQIEWRLVSVNMNSPLTVTAEAVPVHRGMYIEEAAERQKREFARNYATLKAGHIPQAWVESKPREIAARLLARNRNGIGRTTVDASIDPNDRPITITITKADADRSAELLTVNAVTPAGRTKEQVGTVEGKLVLVHQWHNKPAIQIQERKTGKLVWCVVPEEFQHEISESTRVEDVWRGSRVAVKGLIVYGFDGGISRVVATSVGRVSPTEVSEDAIADRNFTGGLSITEYLERLREGKLG